MLSNKTKLLRKKNLQFEKNGYTLSMLVDNAHFSVCICSISLARNNSSNTRKRQLYTPLTFLRLCPVKFTCTARGTSEVEVILFTHKTYWVCWSFWLPLAVRFRPSFVVKQNSVLYSFCPVAGWCFLISLYRRGHCFRVYTPVWFLRKNLYVDFVTFQNIQCHREDNNVVRNCVRYHGQVT